MREWDVRANKSMCTGWILSDIILSANISLAITRLPQMIITKIIQIKFEEIM